MLYCFKKGKNGTETHKKGFVQRTEKVLWLIECVKSGLWSFVLRFLTGQGSTVRWTSWSWERSNWDGNRERSTLYHAGIVDILKISKSIKLLEKIKNVFYFTEKNKVDSLANPIFSSLRYIVVSTAYTEISPHGTVFVLRYKHLLSVQYSTPSGPQLWDCDQTGQKLSQDFHPGLWCWAPFTAQRWSPWWGSGLLVRLNHLYLPLCNWLFFLFSESKVNGQVKGNETTDRKVSLRQYLQCHSDCTTPTDRVKKEVLIGQIIPIRRRVIFAPFPPIIYTDNAQSKEHIHKSLQKQLMFMTTRLKSNA